MADSHVEEGRGGGEQPQADAATPAATATTSPGFKLFGKRILAVAEPRKQQRPTEEIAAEKTQAAVEKQQHASAAAGLACPRCKSRETKFCYFNNYNVNQPRHFCRGCHRYWTAGGALRNVPVGAGRRKTSAAAASRPASDIDVGGSGGGGFGYSNGLMMDGAVVQQWLLRHDGFPAKRPHVASFHDRIR